MIQGFLFDLDGTLVDTAPDLIGALNEMCQDLGHPLPAYNEIRGVISLGAKALVEATFPEMDLDINELKEQFLEKYAQNICNKTHIFQGVTHMLATLKRKAIPWGIVTNKATRFARPIVEKLGLLSQTHCLIYGDTLPQAKPRPEPLLVACQQLSLLPQHVMFVGDALTDIEAAKAAGTQSTVALYGYIPQHATPETWMADRYIQKPEETLAILEN